MEPNLAWGMRKMLTVNTCLRDKGIQMDFSVLGSRTDIIQPLDLVWQR